MIPPLIASSSSACACVLVIIVVFVVVLITGLLKSSVTVLYIVAMQLYFFVLSGCIQYMSSASVYTRFLFIGQLYVCHWLSCVLWSSCAALCKGKAFFLQY
jgi:hypothetical protein